jgi:protein O-GlcNAc transferase
MDRNFPGAWVNYGNWLSKKGDHINAAQCYGKALELEPRSADIALSYAGSLTRLGHYEKASALYEAIVKHQPRHAAALLDLGNIKFRQKNFEDAKKWFGTAASVDGSHRLKASSMLLHMQQLTYDWSDMEKTKATVLEEFSRSKDGHVAPFLFSNLGTSYRLEHENAARYARAHGLAIGTTRRRTPEPAEAGEPRRIRVGYLSADFREHAIASLIAEMIALHDRTAFEVVGYALNDDDGSGWQQYFERTFDKYRQIKTLGFDDAANLMREDRIDILIDLMGYTDRGRPEILARRPAPVQVGFLGFPGTMGCGIVDYIIGDPVVTPQSEERWFTEAVARMPFSYQPSGRRVVDVPAPPTREKAGLPDRGIVFCCFNNAYKITPEVADAWGRIHRQVPGSVLWLLSAGERADGRLVSALGDRGIGRESIVFAPKLGRAEHFARIACADIFLDCLDYTGHTTGSDALWMGVPVVTRIGTTFASRVGASLARAVGLDRLVAGSTEEYVSIAAKLGNEPETLSDIRARLVAERDRLPLFDTQGYVRAFERALRTMHEHGDDPRSFDVAPDPAGS